MYSMMNYIWGGMLVVSFIAACFGGKLPELSNGITSGAEGAVSLLTSLLGVLMLWSGVMKVAEQAGLTEKISRLLSPILKLLFRNVEKGSKTAQAISLNMTANLLGLGSAATPLGISAMKRLYDDGDKKPYATDDMVRFVVINTAALRLIPTTVAMLRQKAGAELPMDILPATIIVSILSLGAGLIMTEVLRHLFKKE